MKLYVNKVIYYPPNKKTYKVSIRGTGDGVNIWIEKKLWKYWPFYNKRVTWFEINFQSNECTRERASKIIRNIEDKIRNVERTNTKVIDLESALDTENSVIDRLKD